MMVYAIAMNPHQIRISANVRQPREHLLKPREKNKKKMPIAKPARHSKKMMPSPGKPPENASIKKRKATKPKHIAPGKKKRYETMASETGISYSETMPNLMRWRGSAGSGGTSTNGVLSIAHSIASSGYSAPQYEHRFISYMRSRFAT
jgi:hypothetical protein